MYDKIIDILDLYKSQQINSQEAVNLLNEIHTMDLGFAKVDLDRQKRQGFPEVIYCAGKTPEQCAEIMLSMSHMADNILATRADDNVWKAVSALVPDAVYHSLAKIITLEKNPLPKDNNRIITVVTAGTSDIPVAQEAALTADIMGNKVTTIYDVGVAGIHRLFANFNTIKNANVIIVVAGMEGALASVIGGLVDKPVIAVPTSVGYGANFGGLSALLGMLNSCSAGIATVNIDNGFGAGRLASIINHMR